jgi:hypothetical protein
VTIPGASLFKVSADACTLQPLSEIRIAFTSNENGAPRVHPGKGRAARTVALQSRQPTAEDSITLTVQRPAPPMLSPEG